MADNENNKTPVKSVAEGTPVEPEVKSTKKYLSECFEKSKDVLLNPAALVLSGVDSAKNSEFYKNFPKEKVLNSAIFAVGALSLFAFVGKVLPVIAASNSIALGVATTALSGVVAGAIVALPCAVVLASGIAAACFLAKSADVVYKYGKCAYDKVKAYCDKSKN